MDAQRQVELLAERDHVTRPEPDDPPERDELGRELRLELAELGDLTCLHQLTELLLDPRPDATQLADAAGADELCGRSRERPDQLGGAPVGARSVRARARELEQRREELQPIGDRRIRRLPLARWAATSRQARARYVQPVYRRGRAGTRGRGAIGDARDCARPHPSHRQSEI